MAVKLAQPMSASARGRPTARTTRRAVVIGTIVLVRSQVAQDREDPPVIAVGRGQAELREDVVDVLFHRAVADEQRGGDGRVGAPFGHQREHLALAGGEGRERVTAARQQLRDDLGVQRAASRRHPVQGLEELGQVRDPVLEQVADAVRPVGQQLGGVAFLHVLREHQHAHLGPAAAYHQRGAQPLVGEGRRHPHVHYHGVGLVLADRPKELLGLPGGRDHVVPGLGEQPGQPLAQQHGVLGDHDPHGSSTSITVPAPAGLSTVSRPSTPDTRSARPDRPRPRGSAPPIPSSRITTESVSPLRSTDTTARVARACLATLVSASATTKYAMASTEAGGLGAASTRTDTGTGLSAARPDSAASSPRSVRTGGCTPRTRFRSSTRASLASAWAWSTIALAASGSSANLALARPRSMARATRRCWAPSCRSRSIRRRSASAESTTRARLSSSSPILALRSALRGGPSSRRATVTSLIARTRVSCGAASSRIRPPAARAAASAAASGACPPRMVLPRGRMPL